MKLSHPLEIYKTLDLNKDGHICYTEMTKAQPLLDKFAGYRNLTTIDANTAFKDLDKNKNGKIEPKEIDESLEGVSIFS